MLVKVFVFYNGYVMWWVFVYVNEKGEECFKQVYLEFMLFDGQFDVNVLVQVKNGLIDFQL